ncbi:MAG: RDD family protein [Myxococcaceae bacterium]|nr:RDD family protein [Myxococcaceae bacterium]
MQAPVGAQCALHPEVAAAAICARCGSFACTSCVSWSGGAALCARCLGAPKPLGSRGLRFLANFVDTMVVLAPTMVGVFVVAIVGAATDGSKGRDDDAAALVGGVAMLAVFGGLVVGAAVQVLMQLKYGQSVGKRLLKLRVVRVDGSPVDVWRLVLLRNVVPHVAAQLCGLIGLVDAAFIFGAEQRCLHDLIADTIVIDVTNEG